MLHRSRNSDDEDDEDTDEEFHTHRLTTSVLDMIETILALSFIYTTLILYRTTLTVPTLTSTLIAIIVMQEQNPFMKKEYGRSSAGFGAHL